jgi:hypothetical protein
MIKSRSFGNASPTGQQVASSAADGLYALRQRLLLPGSAANRQRSGDARSPESGSRSGLFSTINQRFVKQRTGKFRRQQILVYALEVAILGAGIWFMLSGSR